jgi:hypothetical protein
MEIVDKEQFGRAMAFWVGVSSLLQVALSFGLGYLIDRIPESYGYVALALVMALGLSGLAYLLPGIRVLGEKSERQPRDGTYR